MRLFNAPSSSSASSPTINGDDLLCSMTTLGFEDDVEPLKVYLQKRKEMEGKMSMRGMEKDDTSKGCADGSSADGGAGGLSGKIF